MTKIVAVLISSLWKIRAVSPPTQHSALKHPDYEKIKGGVTNFLYPKYNRGIWTLNSHFPTITIQTQEHARWIQNPPNTREQPIGMRILYDWLHVFGKTEKSSWKAGSLCFIENIQYVCTGTVALSWVNLLLGVLYYLSSGVY